MRVLAQRLAQLAVVFLVVSFFTAGLMSLVPGKPEVIVIPFDQTGEQQQAFREANNLDEPLPVRWFEWAKDFLSGDTGNFYSATGGEAVATRFGESWPVSLSLIFYTQVVALAIAIPFAIWAAYRSGGWVDKVINTTAFALISLPSFAIALILTYYLGVKMGWLPTQGYVRLTEDPAEHFRSVAIPVMSLAAGQVAVYMRLLRSDLVATLQEDFILMARSKGISNGRGGAQPAVRGPPEPGGDHRHRLRPHQLRGRRALHRARSAHQGAFGMSTPPPSDDPVEPSKRLPVGAYLAIAWLVLIVGAAIFADFLPLEDPTAEVASLPRMAPGQEGLLLGADNNSRDMLSRTIYGARASLTIAVGAVALGFVVGGLLGLLSGYFRNWIGKVLSSLFDILLAIPALVLALSLVAVLQGGGDAVVSIPLLARITRGNTMAWAQRDFVTAARSQGAAHGRILFREILPNVLPAMGYIAILGIAIAIVAEGGLAILGASVDPPNPSWGVMINDGKSAMRDAPFIMFIPIVATFFTVMSLNYLGDLIRDRFDVRESAL